MKKMQKAQVRTVMSEAWSIAREAQERFGGKASEYISEAMIMAWSKELGRVIRKKITVESADRTNGRNYITLPEGAVARYEEIELTVASIGKTFLVRVESFVRNFEDRSKTRFEVKNKGEI